jgi:PAS domain S-box-containing protein
MDTKDGQNGFLGSLIDAEQIYQDAPCGYFSLCPKGILIKMNRTLLNWLGYEEAELLNQKFTTLLPKGGQMHFEMFFMPLAGVKNAVKELSYEILRKDGTLMPVLLNSTALTDAIGKMVAINNVLTDITERKQYEKDLLHAKRTSEREKKRLQFMADLVPDIIWTATAKGNLNYVNARFCQYFNCDGHQTRAAFVLSKVHKDDLRKLLHTWSDCLTAGTDLRTEVRLLNPDSRYEWHLLKAAKFLDDDGNLTDWFGTCANIDDHIRALKKKDEFINIASHELKTPITSLKAVLQLLERLKDDPSNQMIPGLIGKASRNVGKVNALVEDLLHASQLNDGRLRLNKTQVNLAELIGDCVHHIRMEQQYAIITQGPTDLTVFADEGRLEQVINNFISNAIKYAPESRQVTISLESLLGEVRVEVSDEGPGISPEKIPFLFDRYYQINHQGSKYSGLGLGLYICAEIIKQHEGKIGVSSVPGAGSTFWFSLPS